MIDYSKFATVGIFFNQYLCWYWKKIDVLFQMCGWPKKKACWPVRLADILYKNLQNILMSLHKSKTFLKVALSTLKQ